MTADPISQLSSDALNRLLQPPNVPLVIEDPATHHSISIYLTLENSSQAAYESIVHSFKHNFANVPDMENLLSFYSIEKLISTYTGIEVILNDMCPNTCLAFTGPYSDLEECPMCQASQWNKAKLQGMSDQLKVPAQQFTMIPVGFQLQASNQSPESAHAMTYLWKNVQ